MFVGEFFFFEQGSGAGSGADPVFESRSASNIIFGGFIKKEKTGRESCFRETRGYIQIEWKISVARSHRRRNKIREIRANTIKSHPRRQTPASSNKNCVNFILHGSEPSQGIRVWSFGRADLFLVHFSPQL
jgi:hypothetical protein